MCIQSDLENELYKTSKRNFLDDYSNYNSQQIDMTMSGKYLYKYPKFNIDYSKLHQYPTHDSINGLIRTIKKTKKISGKEIIIGSGTNGILQNIVKVLFKEGGNLVTPFLTFNQPEYAVSSMRGITKRVYMQKDFQIDIEKMIKSVDKYTKMIYICNPNNPTGIIIDNEEIIYLAKKVNTYVVIDESGIEFTKNKSLTEAETPDNVIIVKSLSKAYGIAALRVGYMICSKEFKNEYEENTTVNEVSGISCEYAKKLLLNNNYKENARLIINERKKIEKNLRKLGLDFYPSESNILFSKSEINDNIIEEFNRNGISVMFVKDEREELHFRIAVQDKKTNRIFINKCKKIFKKEL